MSEKNLEGKEGLRCSNPDCNRKIGNICNDDGNGGLLCGECAIKKAWEETGGMVEKILPDGMTYFEKINLEKTKNK